VKQNGRERNGTPESRATLCELTCGCASDSGFLISGGSVLTASVAEITMRRAAKDCLWALEAEVRVEPLDQRSIAPARSNRSQLA
jgi:hypothetical protein